MRASKPTKERRHATQRQHLAPPAAPRHVFRAFPAPRFHRSHANPFTFHPAATRQPLPCIKATTARLSLLRLFHSTLYAMEEAKGSSSSSSSSSSSRWNPTKEQISVLEGLYKQGIRTPSAEQIQQITGKLREYGNIEGKNVFYWFQNHKARQRQKQKQESFAYFSRLLHHAPPPPAPPLPTFPPLSPSCTNINVACSPYYLYQPHQFAPVFPRAGSIEEGMMDAHSKSTYRHGSYTTCGAALEEAEDCSPVSHETLQLFPVHPTGILEEKSPVSAALPEIGRLKGGEGEVVGEISHGLLGFSGGRTSKQR